MNHRIRFALTKGGFGSLLSGEVEADETFIGGKDKTAVMGISEGGGKVRTAVVPNSEKKALQSEVHKHVQAGSALYTNALLLYEWLEGNYADQVIDHADQYVDDRVHTNGMENFWSLLKRGLSGTYVSVQPFHPCRYLVEQSFRHNNREDMGDGGIVSFWRFRRLLESGW